jgi:hypothetical protein
MRSAGVIAGYYLQNGMRSQALAIRYESIDVGSANLNARLAAKQFGGEGNCTARSK